MDRVRIRKVSGRRNLFTAIGTWLFIVLFFTNMTGCAPSPVFDNWIPTLAYLQLQTLPGNSGQSAETNSGFIPTEFTGNFQAYLKTTNTSSNDQFGYSVALSGDTLVVGAPYENSSTTAIINGSDLSKTNDSGYATGAAYVYRRAEGGWILEAYLKPPHYNSNNNHFGSAVAIDKDTIVVGAQNENGNTNVIIHGKDLSATNNAGSNNGAVYVFQRENGIWSHQAYLKAPINSNDDYFGKSVDISGNTIVVGADGEDSNTNNIIHGNDLSATNNSGSINGAAYVFTRTGTLWTHQAYLKAPNTSSGDYFGSAVAISRDSIIIGAYGEDNKSNSILHGSDLSSVNNSGPVVFKGAAYVFQRENGIWSHQAYLKAPNNSTAGFHFGFSVDLLLDTAVVGARVEKSNTNGIINGMDLSGSNALGTQNGAVYVFTRSGNIWSHQAYLKAPNTSNYDFFGSSLSISYNTIVVGSTHEDSNTSFIIHGADLSASNNSGSNNGGAYVYKYVNNLWSFDSYLKAPNNSNNDRFGQSVSIDNGTIALGAHFEDSSTTSIIHGNDLSSTNDSGVDNGAVYMFQ